MDSISGPNPLKISHTPGSVDAFAVGHFRQHRASVSRCMARYITQPRRLLLELRDQTGVLLTFGEQCLPHFIYLKRPEGMDLMTSTHTPAAVVVPKELLLEDFKQQCTNLQGQYTRMHNRRQLLVGLKSPLTRGSRSSTSSDFTSGETRQR
jgi:hypothetical protein